MKLWHISLTVLMIVLLTVAVLILYKIDKIEKMSDVNFVINTLGLDTKKFVCIRNVLNADEYTIKQINATFFELTDTKTIKK